MNKIGQGQTARSTAPLRIGIFTYGMGHSPTGIGRYAKELCYALRRQDPHVELWLLNPYPPSAMPWFQDFPNYSVPRLASLPGVMAWGSWELARAARALRLDILHDPCGIAPFLLPTANTHRVVTVHDAIPLVRGDLQPLPTRVVFRTLIPLAPYTCEVVLTTSRAAQVDLARQVGPMAGKLLVAYPGTHIPSEGELAARRREAHRRQQVGDLPSRYILYVGNQDPRKNVARMLSAYQQVARRAPDVRLVMVGPTPRRRQPQTGGLPAGVCQLGYLSDPDLERVYAGAAAIWFPSLYEGFGQPALEGMAHGVPVITSNQSSLPEVTGGAALLVNPYSERAMADAVLRVLQNPVLARRLAAQGRQRAKRFTWDAMGETVLNIYRTLAGRAS